MIVNEKSYYIENVKYEQGRGKVGYGTFSGNVIANLTLKPSEGKGKAITVKIADFEWCDIDRKSP